MKKEDLDNLLSDDDLVFNFLSDKPHTYKSFLDNHYGNLTYQKRLQRRLKRLVKQGDVWKISIPATRFGVALFMQKNPDFFIFSYQTYKDNFIYICKEFKFVDKKTIVLKNSMMLKAPDFDFWKFYDEDVVLADGYKGGILRQL